MASEPSRPLLLPQNRRLRHLKGIYVRNITLTPPRGQTIDDAVLDKTPQKLEALRSSQLPHAQSSSDLRLKSHKSRRSSSKIATANPGLRQKKLEDVIESRTADTFFTLHCAGEEDPIYISEVVEKATNPTFRFFDISGFGPAITRLDTVTVRVWVKRGEFVPLIQEEINLQSLQFIGKLEDNAFPPSCLVLHLVDGVYTVDLKTDKPPKPKSSSLPLPTSSYSALMRLSSLDESTQDALATQEELARQINSILASQPVDEVPQAQEQATLARRYVTTEYKLLKQSRRRLAELKTSLEARKSAIKAGQEVQKQAQENVNNAQDKLQACRNLHSQTTSAIHGQCRRICQELLTIFPIEPTTHPLLFTICGLSLPKTSFEDADEEVISAALGHVARLVDMLQYYLSVPLPYPISPFSSRSSIHDPISLLADNQRHFPLYMKGTVRFRFDYGVFLLNKDIERLAESQSLRVLDIRQTLPNLLYVLYVCSAGSSELPARKAGGIRGLLAMRSLGGDGTAGSVGGSRRGSDESAASGAGAEVVRKVLENVGKGGSGSGNTNGEVKKELPLPFGSEVGQSLRTSGLRENVIR